MEKRKEHLLKLIIESYIKMAEPVGSSFIVETADLGVSAPTVRNEMRELEEDGYLTHPHTSAGRIPTELGYQYYVENLMEAKEVKNKAKIEAEIKIEKEELKRAKNIAKFLAEETNNAAIVAFSPDNIYYTGISYLFSQPEFRDFANLASVSSIFDNCEDGMDDLFKTIGNEIDVLIGQKNPFGNSCGLLATKFKDNSLIALVGPMRMNYALGISLLKYSKELF